MFKRRGFLISGAALTLTGCGAGNKSGKTFSTSNYRGPQVSRVVVMKARRRMYLMHQRQVLKAYKIDLGYAPAGHKTVEGDGKTPEGRYFIDRRNLNSSFYLSLGISYPNAADVAKAASLGQKPGGDIFIHGQPNRRRARGDDWTAGCISVKNREMEEIYEMVRDGTPIDLYP